MINTCTNLYQHVPTQLINPPTLAELYWQVAIVAKANQLTVLTVDSNVHTGAFLTGFYHPQQ